MVFVVRVSIADGAAPADSYIYGTQRVACSR